LNNVSFDCSLCETLGLSDALVPEKHVVASADAFYEVGEGRILIDGQIFGNWTFRTCVRRQSVSRTCISSGNGSGQCRIRQRKLRRLNREAMT